MPKSITSIAFIKKDTKLKTNNVSIPFQKLEKGQKIKSKDSRGENDTNNRRN